MVPCITCRLTASNSKGWPHCDLFTIWPKFAWRTFFKCQLLPKYGGCRHFFIVDKSTIVTCSFMPYVQKWRHPPYFSSNRAFNGEISFFWVIFWWKRTFRHAIQWLKYFFLNFWGLSHLIPSSRIWKIKNSSILEEVMAILVRPEIYPKSIQNSSKGCTLRIIAGDQFRFRQFWGWFSYFLISLMDPSKSIFKSRKWPIEA